MYWYQPCSRSSRRIYRVKTKGGFLRSSVIALSEIAKSADCQCNSQDLPIIDFLTWAIWWSWKQRLIERAVGFRVLLQRQLHCCKKHKLPQLFLWDHSSGKTRGLLQKQKIYIATSSGTRERCLMCAYTQAYNPGIVYLVTICLPLTTFQNCASRTQG